MNEQRCWLGRRIGVAVFLILLSACSTSPKRSSSDSTNAHATDPVDLSAPSAAIELPAIANIDVVMPAVEPSVELAKDGDELASAEAVLQRLSAQLAAPSCNDPQVLRATKALVRRPDALATKIERVLPMLDYVLAAMEQANLPGQFALIPWAESGFRADPGNRGAVQGLWQFTEQTGRGHGLRIDGQYDGRRAAIESTAAAVDHLTRLQTRFGDWQLSILAYNAGEYRVARGLRVRTANPKALPTGLAAHSYTYLHKIAAIGCILVELPAHNISLRSANFQPMQSVARPHDIHSTEQLARASGIDLDELLRYNAAFRSGDIVDDAPSAILLPVGPAYRLSMAAPASAGLLATSASADASRAAQAPSSISGRRSIRQHVVSAGENLWRIAKRYRVALADLLRWNGLSSRSVIKPGQRLRLTHD